MFPLTLTLDGLPKMTNSSRVHWTRIHKERKMWKNRVTLALAESGYFKAKPDVLRTAKLTLTRYSSVRPDSDGLVSSFKAVIDSLVENDVILDDNFDVIGMPVYNWIKAKPGSGFITVTIEQGIEHDTQTGSYPCP